MTASVAIVGSFTGHFSRAVVSRGIYLGLRNTLPTSVELSCYDVECGGRDLRHHDAAVYVGGYPVQVLQDTQAFPCALRFALFITESSEVPDHWQAAVSAVQHAYAPSRWAASALGSSVRVLQHGVADAFGDTPRARPERPVWACPPVLPYIPALPPQAPGTIRYLHVAGAASFLERKGTPQLLRAFDNLYGVRGRRKDQATLTLRMQPTPEAYAMVRDRPNVYLEPAVEGLDPADMARLYHSYHAVVQPSRAEAFGLVPLEAAHAGVVVIATTATGHREYEPDILIPIATESPQPIAVNGIPAGEAPGLLASAVEDALERFHTSAAGHISTAVHYGDFLTGTRRWAWENTTRPLTEDLLTEIAK